MEMALGLGPKVFSRCKLGWNGIILSSEKFLKEIKGAKGDEGGGRNGEGEEDEGGGFHGTRGQGSAGEILPISQRSSWVEFCWSMEWSPNPQED